MLMRTIIVVYSRRVMGAVGGESIVLRHAARRPMQTGGIVCSGGKHKSPRLQLMNSTLDHDAGMVPTSPEEERSNVGGGKFFND
jgi:hypothetical protein